jgi:hypothetical protein
VVCRAKDNCPGPVVDQEFGQLQTWTQANAFAARLNEGLEIDTIEAEQIVTGSILRTRDVLLLIPGMLMIAGADWPGKGLSGYS